MLGKHSLFAGSLLYLFLEVAAGAQTEPAFPQPPETPNLNTLAAATRLFFREGIDFPMRQEFTLSASKGRGSLRTVNSASSDYVLHGYSESNPQKAAAEVGSPSFDHWLHVWEAIKGEMNNNFLIFLPVTLIRPEPSSPTQPALSFEAARADTESGDWIVTMAPRGECPSSFAASWTRWNTPAGFCGALEVRLRDDLSLAKFTFDASSLPVKPVKIDRLGKCMLQAYRVEIEFREVKLAENAEPFLAPRSVTVTLQTDRGTLIIKSEYKPQGDFWGERVLSAGGPRKLPKIN